MYIEEHIFKTVLSEGTIATACIYSFIWFCLFVLSFFFFLSCFLLVVLVSITHSGTLTRSGTYRKTALSAIRWIGRPRTYKRNALPSKFSHQTFAGIWAKFVQLYKTSFASVNKNQCMERRSFCCEVRLGTGDCTDFQRFVANGLNSTVWTFDVTCTASYCLSLSWCLFFFIPLRNNGAFPSLRRIVDGNSKIWGRDRNCDAPDVLRDSFKISQSI